MKKIILALGLLAITASVKAQTTWKVDPVHSSVNFSIEHLVISEVEGRFKTYTGSVAAPKPDFADSQVAFEIDVASIDTQNEMRDKHLIAEDFFDAAKYPKMSFKSTSFKKVSGNKYALLGNLTLHGITKPARFDVIYGGSVKDGYGNTKAGFKATGVINRYDYNLKYNSVTEAGGATLGKEVAVKLNLQFTKG